MKNCYYIFGLTIVVLIFSCKESIPINPNQDRVEEEIRIEDYIYDYNNEWSLCSQKLGNPANFQPFGLNVGGISKDKNIIYEGSRSSLLVIENGIAKPDNFSLGSVNKQDTTALVVSEVLFCPYDNNLALTLVILRIKEGTSTRNIREWWYYNFSKKTFTRLNLDEPIYDFLKSENAILRWINTSVAGNDQFYLKNNNILSYPSGTIQPNQNGITLRPEEVVHSISPDLKKVFTRYNDELYLNGTKVEKSQFLFWDLLPINWSDDSKYFLGVGLEANFGAQLNIVYKMVDGSNNEFKIYRIADMMRKYCTQQYPPVFGYMGFSNTVFLSDTTFAMTLFPNMTHYGDIFEVTFKGDTLRKLSKYFQ